ncbi:hypothetical protein ACIA8F_13065 [Streptomyces sp. NPDC051563]|uniref:hypothetical protein n=1 Tax=Streptomyces sp. NPDC051563 TaxID=3365659 RepID=UPI0037A9A3A0
MRISCAVLIAGTVLSVLPGAAGATTVPAGGRAAVQRVPVADEADTAEQKVAKELFDAFCKQDPDQELHSREWMLATDSWQSLTPYYLKRPISPDASARLDLFREERLTEDTRKAVCDGPAKYADHLKNVVLDLKGDLRTGCATSRGLTAFYDYKLETVRAINDHQWAKVDKLMAGWRDPKKFTTDTGRTSCQTLTGVADTTK